MTDFDYEVRQRAVLARQARNRKGTVRGPRRCTLPSDNLTPTQLKKKNGKEITYMLDAPITWEEFKAYPDDVKREYVAVLREKHGATDRDLAKMFGVSYPTIGRWMKALGASSGYGGRISKAHRMEWNEWLASWEKSASLNADPDGDLPEVTLEELTDNLPQPRPEGSRMRTTTVSLLLEGKFSLADIGAALANAPIPDGEVYVHINITEKN